MNRHNKQTLLADLADIAARAHDANVTEATQRAIDYAVAERAMPG
jgi:hypothetical protein